MRGPGLRGCYKDTGDLSRRLGRWAIASAKDDRPAYDRVIKTFKALKKEVDAVVGDSK